MKLNSEEVEDQFIDEDEDEVEDEVEVYDGVEDEV